MVESGLKPLLATTLYSNWIGKRPWCPREKQMDLRLFSKPSQQVRKQIQRRLKEVLFVGLVGTT